MPDPNWLPSYFVNAGIGGDLTATTDSTQKVIGLEGAKFVGSPSSSSTVMFDGTHWLFVPIGSGAAATTFGGDLVASELVQHVIGINNHPISGTQSAGQRLEFDGTYWQSAAFGGDLTRISLTSQKVTGLNGHAFSGTQSTGTILQFDGTYWQAVATPAQTFGTDLTAVTTSTQKVVGLNGHAFSGTIIAGTLLMYDGTYWQPVSSASLGTSYTAPARYIADDGNVVLLYKCNETSGSIINYGSAGSAANLTHITTASSGVYPTYAVAGFFEDNALYFSYDLARCACLKSEYNPATDLAYPITIEAWFLPNNTTNASAPIFGRTWSNTWTSPFITWLISITTSGSPKFDITTGSNGSGSKTQSIPSAYTVQQGVWNHIGMTYDGATWKCYLNGNKVSSSSLTGALDYNTSAGSAEIFIGAALTGQDSANAAINRCAAHKVVRSEAWFREQYLRGYSIW